jgi:hypothetical protein
MRNLAHFMSCSFRRAVGGKPDKKVVKKGSDVNPFAYLQPFPSCCKYPLTRDAVFYICIIREHDWSFFLVSETPPLQMWVGAGYGLPRSGSGAGSVQASKAGGTWEIPTCKRR